MNKEVASAKEFAQQALWLHDTIEDCRISYNDIKSRFSLEVAEIVFLVTEYRGRNRNERHSEVYYVDIANNDTALAVKVADLAANILYSKWSGDNRFDMYQKEYNSKIRPIMYKHNPRFEQAFKFIDDLFNQSLENYFDVLSELDKKYSKV